jgi:uncharacterized protein
MSIRLVQDGNDVLLSIKVVPGASADAIAGPLGDRLKVRVAAPPEGGRANQSIERVLEQHLSLAGRVRIESGQTSPLKTVRLLDADLDQVRAAIER